MLAHHAELDDRETLDNVKIFGVSDGGDKQKGMFRIQGMNYLQIYKCLKS